MPSFARCKSCSIARWIDVKYELCGGPRDGDVVDIPATLSRIVVPYFNADTFYAMRTRYGPLISATRGAIYGKLSASDSRSILFYEGSDE